MKGILEENKTFYKMVCALVLPLAMQNLINVAVTSADVIMLGKVGETVLSASSLAGQVQFIMTLIFFGITSGAAVLTSQYWGKGDTRTVEKVMGIALSLSITVALGFMIAVFLFAEPIMRIFTPETAVIMEGVKYLRIVACSYIFIAITLVYLNIMRSVERVVISTIVYSISLVINVILNAIFIFGLCGCPVLGIQGAALATLIARVSELVIVVIYAKKYKPVVKFRFEDLHIKDKLILKDFFKYSTPVMLNELMWGMAISMNAIIIGHLGTSVVAANSVAQVTRQLATVVAFGISTAAAISIGKTIGENNEEKAKDYAWRFVKLSIYAGIAGSIVILGVRPIVMSFLTMTDVARGYLSMMMFIMSYFVIAQSFNTTLIVGVFRAGGDTKYGLMVDVLSMWGGSLLIGALAAFVFKWNVTIVYMLLMSDEIIKIPFTLWRYKSMKWVRNVTR